MNLNLTALAFLGLAMLPVNGARASDAAATVPAMKTEATIMDEVVRLGDLLDNAGAAASVPVFHAPELGTSGTIQTHRIIAAARANGIAHFDARGRNEVTIFRAARNVSLTDLEQAVAQAAMRHLGIRDAADLSVRLDRDVRALQVEPNAAEAPRVVQFSYDPRSQRFEGTVEMTGSLSLRKRPVRLTGTLTETAEVVIIARALSRAESVRESDILVERRPRAEIAGDVLTKSSLVVGQAARRALRAGQTVRPADLMKPDLVGRNDVVTILFEMPGITLTARGKVVDAGAEGDTVAVINHQSKRVLHATVRAPGVVVVSRGISITADATGAIK
jgi:flagella basal body P-ring formation protein FlgA